MAKVVKSQTYDSEYAARAREGGSNTLWIVRKDVFTRARLALHDAPCFGSELEVSVVPELGRYPKVGRVCSPKSVHPERRSSKPVHSEASA